MPAGTVIAGCRIEAVAGRGGMGVVYRATQLALGRTVAIKLIADDRAQVPAFRERFEREARLAAAISHPNVVAVHAAGEDDGRLYLLMEHVAGTDLHALIAEHGRLDPGRTAGIVAQLAAALDAAHEAGLVHRDVKPGNALVCGERVYLGDFGLTRLAASETELTQAGDWIGTVDFTSPEHLRGERCDARADVYSLGCVLFAALVGRPPFPRGTVTATMLAHLNEPPSRVSSVAAVPEAFDAVVARALAKDPGDRYPSAGDLGRAALAAAAGARSPAAERTVARGDAAARPPTAATRFLAYTEVMGAQDPPTAATRHDVHRDRRPHRRPVAALARGKATARPTAGDAAAAAAGPWTPRDGAAGAGRGAAAGSRSADGASTPRNGAAGVPRAGGTGVWTRARSRPATAPRPAAGRRARTARPRAAAGGRCGGCWPGSSRRCSWRAPGSRPPG